MHFQIEINHQESSKVFHAQFPKHWVEQGNLKQAFRAFWVCDLQGWAIPTYDHDRFADWVVSQQKVDQALDALRQWHARKQQGVKTHV